MSRISFAEADAAHIYEWLVRYWEADPKFGGCAQCEILGKRLEKFIGPRAARFAWHVTKRDLKKKGAKA
jgi:hypothetical protein